MRSSARAVSRASTDERDVDRHFRVNGFATPSDAATRVCSPEILQRIASWWTAPWSGRMRSTLAELDSMPQQTQITRHDCVEGWSAIGKWSGVRLADRARCGAAPRRRALRRLSVHGQRRRGKSLLREPRSAPSTASAGAARDASQRRAARSRSRRAGASARADSARLQERQVDRAHRGGRQLREHRRRARAATGKTRATSGTPASDRVTARCAYATVMTRGALVTAALTLHGEFRVDLRVSLRRRPRIWRTCGRSRRSPDATRPTITTSGFIDDADLLDDPTVPRGLFRSGAVVADRFAHREPRSQSRRAAPRRLLRSDGAIRGLGEVLVRSSQRRNDAAGRGVRSSRLRARHPAPLIVLLHGHPQSETQLLAPPFIAELAERTGTIVIAPWGRGYYDFRGSGRMSTTRWQPQRERLRSTRASGFSRAIRWAVFRSSRSRRFTPMTGRRSCASRAALGVRFARVVALMRRTPFYVLTGSADDSIPTRYPTATAAFLQEAGLDVSFYSQPGGIHRLVTLLPILTLAWSDMLGQIVRAPPPRSATSRFLRRYR